VKITISAEGDAPDILRHGGELRRRQRVAQRQDRQRRKQVSRHPFQDLAKAGSYTIKADGQKITTHLKCLGKANASWWSRRRRRSAKPAAAACPEGYKMSGKKGKAGDFTCKGGKGVAAPTKPLACGEGLEYFANDKAQQLGCRKSKCAAKAKK
jgi:hypothetical protein